MKKAIILAFVGCISALASPQLSSSEKVAKYIKWRHEESCNHDENSRNSVAESLFDLQAISRDIRRECARRKLPKSFTNKEAYDAAKMLAAQSMPKATVELISNTATKEGKITVVAVRFKAVPEESPISSDFKNQIRAIQKIVNSILTDA